MLYREYILDHWNEYNLVDSKEDMIKLLNILEAYKENLDRMHDVTMGNIKIFCGLVFNGGEDGRKIVEALFYINRWFTTHESMIAYFQADADYMDETLEDRMQYEEIIKTTDGYVCPVEC